MSVADQLKGYHTSLRQMRPSLQITSCWKCIPGINSNSCKGCAGTMSAPCPVSEL